MSISTGRTARLSLVLAAFVAGLVLCAGFIVLTVGQGPASLVRAAAVGGPFSLIDEHGRPFTDQDLKGKPFLVFFGFVRCPVVCPTTLFEMSEVLRALGTDADRAAGILITLDPERDTPEMLKDYIGSFDAQLHALTGPSDEIARVAKAYRVYYRKVPLGGDEYTVDHTAIVYLMDKQGHFVAPFNVKRSPDAAAAELRRHL
jgi:protein SCO1/2